MNKHESYHMLRAMFINGTVQIPSKIKTKIQTLADER